MSDPFKQYLDKPTPTEKDPFDQYLSPRTRAETTDPFEEYLTPPSEREAPHSADRDVLLLRGDIEDIARKHGVDAKDLRDIAPYYGVKQGPESIGEAIEFGAKGVAGSLGRMALGIPQFLYKRAQDPKMRAALDELTHTGSDQRGYIESAAEMLVSPPVGLIGQEANTALRLGEAAGLGAVTGVANADEGEYLQEAIQGGLTGLAVGGIATGISKFFGRKTAGKRVTVKAENAGEQIVKDVADRRGADFQEGLQKAIDDTSDANNIIYSKITEKQPTGLSRKKVKTVIEAHDPAGPARLLEDEAWVRKQVDAKWGPGSYENGRRMDSDSIQQLAEADIVKGILKNARSKFASELGVKPKAEEFGKWAGTSSNSGEGSTELYRKFHQMMDRDTATKYLTQHGIADTSSDSGISHLLDKILDAQYVLRGLDERWKGLGAEAAHKEINRGINRMAFPRENMRGKIQDIFEQNRQSGLDQKARNASDIMDKLDNKIPLTAEEQKVYAPFQQFMEKSIQEMDDLAYESRLPPLNLVPSPRQLFNQLMDSYKLEEVVKQRVQNLLREASSAGVQYTRLADLPENVYQQVLGNKANRETMQFISQLSGSITDRPGDAERALQKAFSGSSARARMETLSRAIQADTRVIPAWARETDLYKAADKWTTNTLKHLYLRKGMDQLAEAAHRLRVITQDTGASGTGVNSGVRYIEDLLQDIVGYRPLTASSGYTRMERPYIQWIDRKIAAAPEGSARKFALETLRGMPQYLQNTSRNVYDNLLGKSARAVVQNLTQTFTKTLPEFGKYGPVVFWRGMTRVGGLRGLPDTVRRMEQMGLAPSKFRDTGNVLQRIDHSTRHIGYLSDGLARTGMAQKLGKMSNVASHIGSMPFQAAESLNRAIAFGASEVMTKDILSGSKWAMQALEKFPTSVQREAQAAIAKGSETDLLRAIATHVVNNTQYQYNKASMSQYARSMGPLFSQFSKWPTATLGQVVERYRSKGLMQATGTLAGELVLPWIGLELVDKLMEETDYGGMGKDRYEALTGRQGLSGSAPIGNLIGFVPGKKQNFFVPPAVDTVSAFMLDPTQSRSADQFVQRFMNAGANALYMYAPGGVGGWVRLLTDDMVTLTTGERPEGRNFFERSAEGMRRLTK